MTLLVLYCYSIVTCTVEAPLIVHHLTVRIEV